MRGKRVKNLRKIARQHYRRACEYFGKNIPYKTWFRWVKRAYTAGTLRFPEMKKS